jgi:hypothetical protein
MSCDRRERSRRARSQARSARRLRHPSPLRERTPAPGHRCRSAAPPQTATRPTHREWRAALWPPRVREEPALPPDSRQTDAAQTARRGRRGTPLSKERRIVVRICVAQVRQQRVPAAHQLDVLLRRRGRLSPPYGCCATCSRSVTSESAGDSRASSAAHRVLRRWSRGGDVARFEGVGGPASGRRLGHRGRVRRREQRANRRGVSEGDAGQLPGCVADQIEVTEGKRATEASVAVTLRGHERMFACCSTPRPCASRPRPSSSLRPAGASAGSVSCPAQLAAPQPAPGRLRRTNILTSLAVVAVLVGPEAPSSADLARAIRGASRERRLTTNLTRGHADHLAAAATAYQTGTFAHVLRRILVDHSHARHGLPRFNSVLGPRMRHGGEAEQGRAAASKSSHRIA